LPGVPFRRCYYTSRFARTVVFDVLLCRVLLHPFKSFVSGFNRCFAVFIAPDGVMFFDIRFTPWDAIICYVDENIRKFLNRILCTADTVSAEFQRCLMRECCPLAL